MVGLSRFCRIVLACVLFALALAALPLNLAWSAQPAGTAVSEVVPAQTR